MLGGSGQNTMTPHVALKEHPKKFRNVQSHAVENEKTEF